MTEPAINTDDTQVSQPVFERRRKMLPWWVIVFIWVFMLFFVMMPVAVVFALLKRNFQLSLLGLVTYNPFSATGIVIMALFALKGITAFGLWTEKQWAIGLAKVDAIVTIMICIGVMIYVIAMRNGFSLRLELVLAIPYYLKISQIKHDWEHFGEKQDEAYLNDLANPTEEGPINT